MANFELQPLERIDPKRFETPEVLRKLASASRALAELKGVAASIPNQQILLSSLGLQEAKDSSEIENIVTTHDELFREGEAVERAAGAVDPCSRIAVVPPGTTEAGRFFQNEEIAMASVQQLDGFPFIGNSSFQFCDLPFKPAC